MPWKTAPRKVGSPKARANAPRLRKSMTDPEKRLWWHLRTRLPMNGTHFRRQMALGPYVVDFVCLEHRLIIEVDGDQHGTDAAIAYDARRDAYLAADGFRMLRFSNREVMTELEAVLDTIYAATSGPTPTPPHKGEGKVLETPHGRNL
jgi:very-short-patch-repair endonuclease